MSHYVFENVFKLSSDEYRRDINVVRNAIEQSAFYLSKMTGDDITKCRQFMMENMKPNSMFNVRNPTVTHTHRKDMSDRIKKESNLTDYLADIRKNNYIFSPSMTTYLSHEQFEAPFVSFMNISKKERSRSKTAAFVAKAKNDQVGFSIANRRQGAEKIALNSFSGGCSTASTPIFNKTAHHALTSGTRITTSMANANNDKLIGGHRHYFSLDVVLNNIVATCSLVDMADFDRMMRRFGLVYPDVEQTMTCILRSANRYFRDLTREKKIRDFVMTLTDTERAAFVYVGDLYQVRVLNDAFFRQFVQDIGRKITDVVYDDRLARVKEIPEYILFLAHAICFEEARGNGKDHEKMEKLGKLNAIVATAYHIQEKLVYYKDFIRAIMVNNITPSSIARYPESVREVVIMSDTDSTIFTLHDWVQWYYGRRKMGADVFVRDVMLFISSASITHLLSITSANYGVPKDKLEVIAMKSEFVFDVFVPTPVTKHYYAVKSSQEGNIFEKLDIEIKGVHLKSSSNVKRLNEGARLMMEDIMNTVYEEKDISILKYLQTVADIEREIFRSLSSGEISYYRSVKVKDASSYALEEDRSPYKHYLFYKETLSPIYGEVLPPPYAAVKITTVLDKPKSIQAFSQSIADTDFGKRFIEYTRKNPGNMGSIYIPWDVVSSNGVPKELIPVIDMRSIVEDSCYIYYMILASIGYHHRPYSLVSDFY